MCIVCNCGEKGDEFLYTFYASSRFMKAATKDMLECSKVVKDPDQAKQYDKIHKQMVRLCKEWDKVEHNRELK